MTATLLQSPVQQFLDANGNPYAGASLSVFVPATTTPATTWLDQAQTTPNSNPIVLNSAGECTIWASGSYRFQLHDALGNLVFDQVTACNPAVSAAMAPFLALGSPTAGLAFLGGDLVLPTIAALRGNTTTVGLLMVSVAAYYLPGDNGGGPFVYVPADTTSADNGGTIIVDAANQRWYRLVWGEGVSIAWFGAETGSSDSTSALNAALAASQDVYFP